MPATPAADDTLMRAVIATEYGPFENLRLGTTARPRPGEGQVLVEIHAAAIAYVDALIASGRYQVKPDLPFAPGSEFAGVVVDAGPGVDRTQIGARVIGWGFTGGLAEYAVVPADGVTPIPDTMPFNVAAGFRVNYATAYHGLAQRGRAAPGETILVTGAAGAIGAAAVEIAKVMGLTVIAGASTAEKRAFALQAGADHAIDYTAADFRDRVRELTGGRGLDLVFDPVCGPTMEAAFRSLAWKGRHLVVGFVGGEIPRLPVNLALLKGADLVGVDWARFSIVHEVETSRANTRLLLDWYAQGRLNPAPARHLAFEDFGQGFAAVSGRASTGRTVVAIRPA